LSSFFFSFIFFFFSVSSSYASNIESFSYDFIFLLLLLISVDCLSSFVFLSPVFFAKSVDNREFLKGLKLYIRAISQTKNSSLEQYKKKIEQRIRDLKIRLGEEEFKKLEKEIIKNG
jgi:hypothetical protein